MTGINSLSFYLVLIIMFLSCNHDIEKQDVPLYAQEASDTMLTVLRQARDQRKINPRSGFKAYEQALEQAKEHNDPAAILEAYRRLIFIAGVQLHATDTAVAIAREAIEYGHRYDDANTLCEMYGLLGIAYQVAGNPDSAVAANLHALKYMELDDAPDSLKNWPLYLNVSAVYSTLGNYPLAIENTKKYLYEYAIPIKDTLRIISAYNNLSNYYTLQNDYKSSEEAIRTAYRLNTTSGIPMRDEVLLGMAAMYNNIGKYDSAFHFAQASYELYKKMEAPILMNKAAVVWLESIFQSSQLHRLADMPAEHVIGNAKRVYSRLEPLDMLRTITVLQRYYEYKGQLDSAYKYLGLANQALELIRTTERNDQLVRYDIERKKAQSENQLLAKQIQITNQQNLILVLSTLCIAIVAITTILISRNRRKHALALKHLEFMEREREWDKERAVFQSQLEERNRISRELHDDLGANLTSIILTGEIIKKKSPELWSDINNITESANEMADTLNEIVWSLNNRNDSLHGLAAYVRKFAVKFLQRANISLQFDADLPEEDVVVDSVKRRLIYLSMKELINNCIKHSHATEVKIRFHYAHDMLTIDVIDNGTGLPENIDHSTGNGLKNLHRNMEMINGSYHCKKENGLHSTLNIRIAS